MRNKLTLLITSVLMAGTVFARQDSDSIQAIMDELMNYTETNAPAATEGIPPATGTDPQTPVEQSPELAQTEAVSTSADPVVAVDRRPDPVPTGDFTNTVQGLAELIELPPESLMDRMYPRTLQERDHRTAEIDGMKAVDEAWSTDLVLRSYELADGASARMQLGDEPHAVDVGVLFPQVTFPKEASALYQPETGTIFVNNTPENLAVLETMLETMGVLKGAGAAEQIEIEAKFVEVSEGTLEELGFQWNFDDPTHVGIGGTDMDVNDGVNGLFSDALRGNPVPFSQPGSLGTTPGSGTWSSFRFEDTFNSDPSTMGVKYTGNNGFEVLMTALDQSTGTDVLSAPRILTRNGEEATIQVGELHYFPEVFQGDSAQATILNISYEDFTETLLGIELTVTPKVQGENEIMIRLNPRISELAGWQSYQLAPESSIYNHRQLEYERPFDTFDAPFTASLPVFKVREIDTTVTIANGSTIGMGGLISEKVEAFEDRVPLLGHIPLVGRLFRSEGERVVKRNLLMFVTAKIVAPNGRINTTRSFE